MKTAPCNILILRHCLFVVIVFYKVTIYLFKIKLPFTSKFKPQLHFNCYTTNIFSCNSYCVETNTNERKRCKKPLQQSGLITNLPANLTADFNDYSPPFILPPCILFKWIFLPGRFFGFLFQPDIESGWFTEIAHRCG